MRNAASAAAARSTTGSESSSRATSPSDSPSCARSHQAASAAASAPERGGRCVVQWCFAAVGTVETTLVCLDIIDIFDSDRAAQKVRAETQKLAHRWLGDVERRLEGHEWIACADFTVADIMMACVLRSIRKTDLMEPYPRIKAYYERTLARPAWQRTLALYAERVGVSVDDIR